MAFSTLPLFAQKQQLLKSVSAEACACIQKASPDDDFETVLGLCLLKAASPRSEELEEALGLDLTDLSNFEKLGELLAPSLMMNCPEFIAFIEQLAVEGKLDLSDTDTDTEEEDDEEEESPSFGQWSDIANSELLPTYGGPENKSFILTHLAHTTGVGLPPLRLVGKITDFRPGLVTELNFLTDEGERLLCYLDAAVPGQALLRKGQAATLTYRFENRYHAGQNEEQRVRIVTRIE